MATLPSQPHFMQATQASRARDPGSDEPPCDAKADDQVASTSRRGQLIATASRHLKQFSKRDSQVSPRPCQSLRISSPYGFQKIDDPSPTLPESIRSHPSSSLKSPQPVLSPTMAESASRCTSPLDKPLPSLPVAIIQTDSPLKARRSLIDAMEKPLRRSLSPCTTEDWPALFPEKLTPASSNVSRPRHTKVSLGESIIERVKQLNIHDDEGTPCPTTATGLQARGVRLPSNTDTSMNTNLSTGRHETPPDSHINASHLPSPVFDDIPVQQSNPVLIRPLLPKSTRSPQSLGMSGLPVAKQKTNIDIRKRLSSTPLTSEDKKKLKVGSSGDVSIPDNSPVARGRDTNHQANDHQPGPIRDRSWSRHRVTDGGSPYVIPKRSNTTSQGNQSSRQTGKYDTVSAQSTTTPNDGLKNSFAVMPSTLPYISPPLTEVVDVKKTRATSGASKSSRISSIPVPAQFSRPETVDECGAHVIPPKLDGKPFVTPDYDTCDADIDTDGDYKHARRLSAKSQRGSVSTMTAKTLQPLEAIDSVSPIVTTTRPDEGSQLQSKEAEASRSSELNPEAIHEQTDLGGYKVRSLNCSAPQYGARLRVSNSASSFLFGTGVGTELLGRDVTRKHNSLVELPAQSLVSNFTTTSAPPVKPGMPKDVSNKEGWPFRESIVAPFKQVESATHSRIECPWIPQEESRNHVSQPDNSPGTSVESKYDLVEFQKNTARTDADKGRKVAFTEDATNAGFGSSIVKQASATFPPRISSRNTARKPLPTRVSENGTPRSTAKDTRDPPRPRSPLGKTTPASHSGLMKSFSHSNRQVKTDPSEKTKPISSPAPVPGAVSTGKGVMSNIRGLFHKRLGEQPNGYRKLHQSLRAHKAAVQSEVTATSGSAYEHPSRIPRTPPVQKASPTIYERRHAHREPQSFTRGHRDIATVTSRTLATPVEPDTDELASRYILEPFPTLDTSSPTPAPTPNPKAANQEIDIATHLAHDLLDRANKEVSTARQMELVEMSTIIVQILEHARNAEKAKEEAKHAAIRAEIECLKIKHEIQKVTTITMQGLGRGKITTEKVTATATANGAL